MVSVNLKCPKCGQHYNVELEPGEDYDEITCEKCGSKIPYSAQVPSAPSTRRSSGPPPAAPFFFCCSMGSFIAADVAAISESPVLANSLYWSGVAFVLLAIYLKIQWK